MHLKTGGNFDLINEYELYGRSSKKLPYTFSRSSSFAFLSVPNPTPRNPSGETMSYLDIPLATSISQVYMFRRLMPAGVELEMFSCIVTTDLPLSQSEMLARMHDDKRGVESLISCISIRFPRVHAIICNIYQAHLGL